MIKLGIVGCRYYTNYSHFCDKLIEILDKDMLTLDNIGLIISGGATGVDAMAEKFARENNIDFKVFEARWDKYGNNAGPKRNSKIVEHSTMIIAFPSKTSKGTYDTIKKAKNIGKDLYVINI